MKRTPHPFPGEASLSRIAFLAGFLMLGLLLLFFNWVKQVRERAEAELDGSLKTEEAA